MSEFVVVTQQDGVAVITVQNPPVNALGPGVPDAIFEALSAAERDSNVQAIVVIGGGRTFIAARTSTNCRRQPRIRTKRPTCTRCCRAWKTPSSLSSWRSTVPRWAVASNLPLAGHYRVASPDALLGAPESNLGIIPGAEGTQRLPRLVGVPVAIELCVSGRLVKADECLKLGLVDRIIEGNLLQGACAFAQEIATQPSAKPVTAMAISASWKKMKPPSPLDANWHARSVRIKPRRST